MRRIRSAAVAAALAGLTIPLSATAYAAATPGVQAESFVMNFQTVNGVDAPTHVTAAGPISGTGIETQTDEQTQTGEVVQFTWHFSDGTVTADAVEQYNFVPDYKSCTAKAVGTGTWTVMGGTGAYAGAQGNGTFTDHGSFVGARDVHGACDPNAEPTLSNFTLRGIGSASFGASA
jgi:hypothetical protein